MDFILYVIVIVNTIVGGEDENEVRKVRASIDEKHYMDPPK